MYSERSILERMSFTEPKTKKGGLIDLNSNWADSFQIEDKALQDFHPSDDPEYKYKNELKSSVNSNIDIVQKVILMVTGGEIDVFQYLQNPSFRIKYFGHIEKERGHYIINDGSTDISLEGWQEKPFFSLNIFFHIYLLFQLKKKPDEYQSIIRELMISIRQQFEILQQTSAMEIIDKDNSALMIDSLLTYYLERVKKLEITDSFVIPTGTKNHSIYIEVKRHEKDKVCVIIHNRGYSCSYHEPSNGHVEPFVRWEVDIQSIRKCKKGVYLFLENILKANFGLLKDSTIYYIYGLDSSKKPKSISIPALKLKRLTEQKTGHCIADGYESVIVNSFSDVTVKLLKDNIIKLFLFIHGFYIEKYIPVSELKSEIEEKTEDNKDIGKIKEEIFFYHVRIITTDQSDKEGLSSIKAEIQNYISTKVNLKLEEYQFLFDFFMKSKDDFNFIFIQQFIIKIISLNQKEWFMDWLEKNVFSDKYTGYDMRTYPNKVKQVVEFLINSDNKEKFLEIFNKKFNSYMPTFYHDNQAVLLIVLWGTDKSWRFYFNLFVDYPENSRKIFLNVLLEEMIKCGFFVKKSGITTINDKNFSSKFLKDSTNRMLLAKDAEKLGIFLILPSIGHEEKPGRSKTSEGNSQSFFNIIKNMRFEKRQAVYGLTVGVLSLITYNIFSKSGGLTQNGSISPPTPKF